MSKQIKCKECGDHGKTISLEGETVDCPQCLNRRVAVAVMGWTEGDRGYWDNAGDASDYRICEWSPMTDVKAAFEVAEKASLFQSHIDTTGLDVGLCLRQVNDEWEIFYRYGVAILRNKSLPALICEAALMFNK
jgi:hypothetical protein